MHNRNTDVYGQYYWLQSNVLYMLFANEKFLLRFLKDTSC